MNIAIIGAGRIGGALAKHWATAGHKIYLGVRNTESSKYEPFQMLRNISIHSITEAAQAAKVLLIATPANVVLELVEQLGTLEGKVLIDATNAVQMKPMPYPTATHVFVDRTNAEVVKCFNVTGMENVVSPNYGSVALDMFMAGNSERAKIVAEQLATAAGFEHCYNFGGLDKVELLEQFAAIWINLAFSQGLGRNFGFKILNRS